MCGIAGHLNADGRGPGNADAVKAMCQALVHRGPDAAGFQAAGPVALGHRRLSIIDLSADGNQPIFNEDRSVFAVINGEIYNHHDLRRDLEARGHRFRSRSDSETVVHLYEEHGEALVDHLRGMFAFALWDTRAGKLLLARDRVGKKPLYFSDRPEGFYFASELPALLAGLPERPPPDLAALDRYLTLQYVPSPLTAFQGVEKLPPAHVMVVKPGRARRPTRYWKLGYTPHAGAAPARLEDTVAEVRSLLEESVRLRMIADVPVGAFLSGGVDSSAVVALMARASDRPVKTFSIDFPGGAGEVRFARLVARRYRTDHHEMTVRPDMTSILPELVRRFGEPFADTSAVPVYYLSRLTREQVTVALSGDGSDETFAGYRRYLWHSLGRGIERLPRPLRAAVAATLARLPSGAAHPVRQFAAHLGLSAAESYLPLIAHFSASAKADLRGPLLRIAEPDPVTTRFAEILAAAGDTDDVNRLLALDVETYLPDDILTKVDITSMAHALEVRAPFVDHVLMERVAALPGALKLRGLRGKRILRQAIGDLIPRPILTRRKKGFSMPVDGWFRGELRGLVHDVLTDGTSRARGLFQPAAVAALLDQHAGGVNHGERLWNLLVLELWFRTFVDGKGAVLPAASDARVGAAG
jgi:asparagine synthase (glutamine-hydrolysing)